ncbi:MAG: tRNA (adenosine(37)-N6)-dimethylallyltransferase MiaA [Bdellovibrionota bacterium]
MKVISLIGPTASGKSELALRLAQKHGAHILSCDSLLVYKGMTIGTAKPSAEELGQVPHYGIDLIDPSEPFTAVDYVRYARPLLDELYAKKTPVLIVGGTGFYLKALLCGVWDAPPTQPEIRERLEKEVAHLSLEQRGPALHERLAKRDAEYAEKVNPNDLYRVIRALEIIEVTGEKVSELLAKRTLQNPLPYAYAIYGIKRPKLDLERRIIERTNGMFSKGIVNETKDLLAKFGPKPPRPFSCVGYNEVMQLLDGTMTLPECRERVVISTRQLAKKQMTFFKGFPSPIEWFTLPHEEEMLTQKIEGDWGSSR